MKKILSLFLITLMICVMTSCKNKEEEKEIGLANPITEVESLEKLNAECEAKIIKPAVMGISEEKFLNISANDITIAEYAFRIAGRACSIRSAKVKDDISGYYIDGNQAFDGIKEGIEYKEASDCFLSRFFVDDQQYVFVMERSENTEMEYFMMISEDVASIHGLTLSDDNIYRTMCGNYYDLTSKRASLTAETNDGSALMIEVDWSSSAEESNRWIMTARLDEEGKLVYDDLAKMKWNGKEFEVIEKNIDGYFEIDGEGRLLWTGAKEESLRECIFEMSK